MRAGGSAPSGQPFSAACRRGSPASVVSASCARGVRMAMRCCAPSPLTRRGRAPAMPSCTSTPLCSTVMRAGDTSPPPAEKRGAFQRMS
ncbi:hypothetical protein G6F24_017873 [Rhizopus arrhizus]|nr:hypothetical protein G6F24_017873 [Rhizopus arrhizus]